MKICRKLLCIACSLILLIQLASCTGNSSLVYVGKYSGLVNEIITFQNSFDVPTNYSEFAELKKQVDLNNLVQMCGHLAIEEGWKIEYLYKYESNGGRIHIIPMPVETTDTEIEGYYNFHDSGYVGIDRATLPDTDLADKIISDGTDDGYVEFAILHTLAPNTMMWWHSLYDKTEVIYDSSSLMEYISRCYWSDDEQDSKKKAMELNPEPVITRSGDSITVELLTFKNWGGFYKSVYTFAETDEGIVFQGCVNTLLVEYISSVTM